MKVIVSCHQDYVRALARPHHPDWRIKDGWVVRGTLDNSVPCAVALSLLADFRSGTPPADLVFTDGEERGWPNMTGANRVARRVRSMKEPAVVVVADVCSERGVRRQGSTLGDVVVSNWWGLDLKAAGGIVQEAIGQFVALEPLNFKDEDNENECWTYARRKVPCIAVELPVKGDFHTKQAGVSCQRIDAYRDALRDIVRHLQKAKPEELLLPEARKP